MIASLLGVILALLSPPLAQASTRPVTFSATVGQPFSGVVGYFSSCDCTPQSATIDWGDFNAVAAGIGCTGKVAVTTDSSNYRGAQEVPGPPTADVSPDVGAETAEPVFVNAPAGDYHQLPGSPTVNRGTADALLGAFDFDASHA